MSMSILGSGLYTITSLSGEGGAAGVPPTKPAFQQVVTFPRGEFPSQWKVIRTPQGTYILSTMGYSFTGVEEDRVNATIYEEQNQEWIFTSFEHQGKDLYAIELTDRSKAWTTDNPNANARAVINAEPLRTTKSLPPQAFPPQLFQIQRVLE
ncbi:hypothetical protein BDP27DRAFT_1409286 [Rhodocollybia butyracea]|uniref:Uncharacterized protein n=1 Tax=Rhodocollybia butyracea TaxID=206335 RepID=A0A9P5P706_9AGAR|nr:hypothetical protein BDP27DRAFT_1409286 [Rhodocollybia butyracea]